MKRHPLSACMLLLALMVFLLSTVAAQATEANVAGHGIPKALSVSESRAEAGSPPANSASLIAPTSLSMIYLPLLFKMDPPCTVAPTLSSPANGSTLNTLIPTLQWNAGNDPSATTTVVEVAKDTGFTQRALRLWYYSAQGTGQFQMSSNLEAATTYYWRAYLLCSSDLQSPYSAVWWFVSGSGGTVLPAPALVAPANGSTVPSVSVNLQWSAVSGASKYLVWLQKVGTGSRSVYGTTGTQTTVDLDAGATYQWWVAAQNDYAIGTASGVWQFTTPAAGSLNSPGFSDGTVVTSDGVTTIVQR